MRDLERLEELSGAAALGLWADDVIIALDRAAEGTLDDVDRTVLVNAVSVIDAVGKLDAGTLGPPARSARSFAAAETAITVAVSLARVTADDECESGQGLLATLSEALDSAVKGESDATRSAAAIRFFTLISQRQLAKTNSISSSRRERGSWKATKPISSFS